MRNTIKDGAVADKLTPEDKEAIDKAVDKTVEWLDHNQARVHAAAAAAAALPGGERAPAVCCTALRVTRPTSPPCPCS